MVLAFINIDCVRIVASQDSIDCGLAATSHCDYYENCIYDYMSQIHVPLTPMRGEYSSVVCIEEN